MKGPERHILTGISGQLGHDELLFLDFWRGMRLGVSFKIDKMDESELKRHLKTISERPIPNLPSDIVEPIWVKIRVEKAIARRENWLDRLVFTLLRPRSVIAVFAVTLLVGGNFGLLLANSEGSIRRPLGFEVFASDAPTLPSTLLSQTR